MKKTNLSFIVLLSLFFLFFNPSHIKAQADIDLVKLTIGPPVPAIPYYHFRGKINLPEKTSLEIKSIKANGNPVYSYQIRDIQEGIDLREPYSYSWPLFASDKISKFKFKNPWIVGRLDWENNKTYSIEIELVSENSDKAEIISKEVQAPQSGGYWNSQWKFYKSIVVTEDYGLDRVNEPIDFSLIFYPDQITDLKKELRLVQIDQKGKAKIITSQVYNISTYLKKDKKRYDDSGNLRPFYWLPSVYAKIVAPVSLKANSSTVLLAFYGNPNAEMNRKGDCELHVSGKGLDLAVENKHYWIKLHPESGMLHEISLKSKPDITLQHKLETNGAIHWNPGAYSPPRPWMHASDWNPPKEYSTIEGPVMFVLHRKGHMPRMPEIALGITYKFFAHQPYVQMTSNMQFLQDVPLQALRNGEVVFDHKLIDYAAWKESASEKVHKIKLESVPLLTEIHLPLSTQWMSFFNSKKKIGFGGIPLNSSQTSLGKEPITYNPYFYITRGPWVYWTRVLAAPYLTKNIQQIVTVPSGNMYWEKWAYLPFEMEKDSSFEALKNLRKRLDHPLKVSVIDERDPRVEIPEEIYTDPEKTGWEKKKTK